MHDLAADDDDDDDSHRPATNEHYSDRARRLAAWWTTLAAYLGSTSASTRAKSTLLLSTQTNTRTRAAIPTRATDARFAPRRGASGATGRARRAARGRPFSRRGHATRGGAWARTARAATGGSGGRSPPRPRDVRHSKENSRTYSSGSRSRSTRYQRRREASQKSPLSPPAHRRPPLIPSPRPRRNEPPAPKYLAKLGNGVHTPPGTRAHPRRGYPLWVY